MALERQRGFMLGDEVKKRDDWTVRGTLVRMLAGEAGWNDPMAEVKLTNGTKVTIRLASLVHLGYMG